MTLAATSTHLVGVWFDGQKHAPDWSAWPTQARHPVLATVQTQLREYFDAKRSHFDLPLDFVHGTPFQRAVWQALLTIPCGTTLSYGQLSARVGNPKAVRAIGAAVGRNPLSIVVPCHRVVGANGSLTGYAGGLDRKAALLTLESQL
jgi:methylated-DNA-[protein]-cysteine S-methyltransferase